MSGLVDNIRASLLGLKMPRALEMLDHMVQRLEKGEIGAICDVALNAKTAHSTISM